MRIILKWLTSRLMIVAPLIAMQFLLFVSLVYSVSIGYKVFPIVEACAVIAVLYIINRQLDPYYKLAWCCLILGLPVVGLPLYFLAGERHVPKKIQNGTILADRKMAGLLVSRDHVQDRQDAEEDVVPIMRYCEECGFPVYRNTDIKYYSTGEEWYEAYLEELRKAKHYIFVEFFIIRKGQCWSEVLDILKQKIAEGVEVKIIYDDFGSVEMPIHYDRKLRELGIEAHRFNHIRPAFIIQMNNRDHRKITIIDNKVAFTGGVNLADEYANKIKRFGYWKDSAIRLEGDAVWSLTVMFLGLLTHVRGDSGEPIDYQKYRITHEPVQADSFVQPYSDSPTDDEPVCLNMHLNMVNHARDYIYIERETPASYAISIDAGYKVSEHGLEFVEGSELAVWVAAMYGPNLRDKLERDVVTYSAQDMGASDQAQARMNIGAASAAELASEASARAAADGQIRSGLCYVESGDTIAANANYTTGKFIAWKGEIYRIRTTINASVTASNWSTYLEKMDGVGGALSVINGELGSLSSKIKNSLKSGQNSIGNIIVPGYNTGSGNYFDFFVPCSTGGKTVTSASLADGTAIYLPTTIANFSSAPEVTVIGQTDYGVRLEVRYPSTNTPNVCGNIYAIELKLTCS